MCIRDSHVLVHDAARAFTPPSVFRAVQDALAAGAPAAVPGLPVTDTIKTVTGPAERPVVSGTPARSSLRAVQTPQGFDLDLLLAAHEAARASAEADPAALTDDAMAMEAAGHAAHVGDRCCNRALQVRFPERLGCVREQHRPTQESFGLHVGAERGHDS